MNTDDGSGDLAALVAYYGSRQEVANRIRAYLSLPYRRKRVEDNPKELERFNRLIRLLNSKSN